MKKGTRAIVESIFTQANDESRKEIIAFLNAAQTLPAKERDYLALNATMIGVVGRAIADRLAEVLPALETPGAPIAITARNLGCVVDGAACLDVLSRRVRPYALGDDKTPGMVAIDGLCDWADDVVAFVSKTFTDYYEPFEE